MVTTLDLQMPEVVSEPIALPGDAEVRTSLELISELYNYNHWIFNKIRPFLKGRLCEIGCGIGTITQFTLNHEKVVGVEPSPESLQTARERFSDHLNVQIADKFLSACPCDEVPEGGFDSVICLNVLEHIEDDINALQRMRRLCAPKGRVVILVPAHMSIFGRLDESFGHWRRYNRRTLRRAFEQAGLKVTYSFYMNSLGYFGWWLQSRVLRRDQISLKSARFFNRLVPFLDATERLFPLPFGQSVVMVGTPTDAS
jgi:SAM-dependent methyltransferase